MQIIQKFRDQLPRLVTEELEGIVESIRAYWGVEHHEDGTHGAVTADSLTVYGQYYSLAHQHGASGEGLLLDFNDGNEHSITLTTHCTFTFANPKNGGRYTLMLTQGGAGGWTVTWPDTVRWNGGPAPTLTATAGRTDLVVMMYLAAENVYVAAYNLDYNLT